VQDVGEALLERLVTGQVQPVEYTDELCAIEHQVDVVADHA
jgi:hypothetical protein